MRYIVCYRLHRKNARRKELLRENYENVTEAVRAFQIYCSNHTKDLETKDYELLTGDWQHIAYYTKDGLNYDSKYVPIEKFKGSKEIIKLYFGMSKSMQKAVKDIMLVANGKEIE